jgi:hypothetical protein
VAGAVQKLRQLVDEFFFVELRLTRWLGVSLCLFDWSTAEVRL